MTEISRKRKRASDNEWLGWEVFCNGRGKGDNSIDLGKKGINKRNRFAPNIDSSQTSGIYFEAFVLQNHEVVSISPSSSGLLQVSSILTGWHIL